MTYSTTVCEAFGEYIWKNCEAIGMSSSRFIMLHQGTAPSRHWSALCVSVGSGKILYGQLTVLLYSMKLSSTIGIFTGLFLTFAFPDEFFITLTKGTYIIIFYIRRAMFAEPYNVKDHNNFSHKQAKNLAN